jgi:uncharacterized membrane protein (UPF0127 family)
MPLRLRRLPILPVRLGGIEVRVAATARARLLGLSGLRARPPCGLLLSRTRSVHTFGMRFPLDLVWLDAHGRAVRVDASVPPRRLRSCRAARAVIELPADGTQRSSRAVAYPSSRLTGSRTSDV